MSNEIKKEENKNGKKVTNYKALGISLGMLLGVAFGTLYDKLALGLALGSSFGISLGLIFESKSSKVNEDDSQNNDKE